MRIKFNDKIYRLKNGFNGLMELDEEPKYNHGDFLMTRYRLAFIFDREGENGEAHHLFTTDMDGALRDDIQERGTGTRHCGYLKDAVLADQEAIKIIHDGLKSIGKRWNTEKKCIEDIPVYKDGDFVVNDSGSILIFKEAKNDCIFNHAYLSSIGVLIINGGPSLIDIKRHATTEEKQRMINALAERGKRWNKDKRCVEDIPKRKFKAGDKVRIKDGISSKTHSDIAPSFLYYMDDFIGTTMTVSGYTNKYGYIVCKESGCRFHEDWLEPYTDEPKKGDLAIFWDDGDKNHSSIRVYNRKYYSGYYDSSGIPWDNAIKFESKEQFEKVLRGEI